MNIAAGVTHRVGIFTKNKRLLRIVLYIILAIPRAHVHRAENIGPRIIGRLLILYRARRIKRTDSLILRDEIVAETGLITHRPNNNRRMVSKSLNHIDAALYVRIKKSGFPGIGILTVAGAVRFDISLAYDIKARTVAKFVPGRIIGIMARSYGIDMKHLHNRNIALHTFESYRITALRLHFMAINTHKQSALTVNINYGILNLDLAEAEGHCAIVAAGILNGLVIHVRRFTAPEFRLIVALRKKNSALLVADYELTLGIIVRKLSFNNEILAGSVIFGYEPHVAENTRKAPKILILEECSIAMLNNFNFKEILAVLEIFRKIKFCGQATVFRVADFFTVKSNIHRGRYSAEVKNSATRFPIVGNGEL